MYLILIIVGRDDFLVRRIFIPFIELFSKLFISSQKKGKEKKDISDVVVVVEEEWRKTERTKIYGLKELNETSLTRGNSLLHPR